jgi:hypothetical protein
MGESEVPNPKLSSTFVFAAEAKAVNEHIDTASVVFITKFTRISLIYRMYKLAILAYKLLYVNGVLSSMVLGEIIRNNGILREDISTFMDVVNIKVLRIQYRLAQKSPHRCRLLREI